MQLTKAAVFRTLGALPLETLLRGLIVGSSLMVGAWLAKFIVLGMDASRFRHVLEIMMALSGAFLIWQALI